MATGDKSILAFANRDSLKYKSTRDYYAGSIVLSGDGLFYEANGDVPSGTSFTEGTTGATWKVVGGKQTPDWVQSDSYKQGDLVFKSEAIWEANNNIPANTSWSIGTTGATWKLKAGLLNGELWEESGKTLRPKTADDVLLGDSSHHIEQIHQRLSYYYDGSGNTMGYLYPRDSSNFFLAGNSKNLNLGYKTTEYDITLGETKVDVNKETRYNADCIITNGNELQFRDGDGDTEWEGITIKADGNDVGIYGVLNSTASTTAAIDIQYNGPVNFGYSVEVAGDFTVVGDVLADSDDSVLGGTGLKSRFHKVRTEHLTFYAAGSTTTWGFLSCDADGDVTLDANKGNNVYLENSSDHQVYMSGSGSFRPTTDGDNQYLGSSSERWEAVYAQSSTINTSDAREKDFTGFPEELLDVWLDYVKPMAYRWKKSVEKKGDSARIHAGVVAQDIIKAFNAANLDWTKYAVVCANFHDKESDSNIVPDDFDPTDIDNLPALMVRYDHVMVIEMAAHRYKLSKLENKLNAM